MKRIVEIKKDGHLYYVAQYKFLFWWRTYITEDYDFCSDGIGSGFDIAKFSSVQDAINFIRSDENNKKKSKLNVVWQSN